MDLIEEFVRRTDNGLAPERYRRWSAMVMIAAVLDRRVYTAIRPAWQLWPNLYVLLVGPPGVGKTMAILPARELVMTQPHVALAPNHTSYESFIKQLGERALEVDTEDAMPRRRATMALMLSEWGTFLRRPDNDHLSMLADVFDCGDYKAETIKRGVDNAENLYINILAACTPAWFAEGFPPNAYEQGLPTRMIMVYEETLAASASRVPYVSSMEDPVKEANALTEALWPALERLASLRGFAPFTPEATAALNTWQDSGHAPAPDDPLLTGGYCTRRPLQVGKLALLYAVARHPRELEVQLADFIAARDLLLDAETTMPKALSAAGGNIYQLRMQAIATFVEKRYIETKRYVPEWEVMQKLGKLVPPNLLRTIIDAMVNQQMIRKLEGTSAPNRKLSPGVTK